MKRDSVATKKLYARMRYTALSLASNAHTTPQKKAKISQYLSRETWSTFGEILREFEFFCSTFAKYDNFWNKIVDMPLKEVGHRESPARIIPRMLPWDFRKDFVKKKSLDLVTKPLTSYFLRRQTIWSSAEVFIILDGCQATKQP